MKTYSSEFLQPIVTEQYIPHCCYRKQFYFLKLQFLRANRHLFARIQQYCAKHVQIYQ